MDRPAAVATLRLTKYYGATRGIEGMTLRVRRGEVFGLLGPNGSGKTTTIRLLLGLLRPTRGRAALLGLEVGVDGVAARRRVGYLPDTFHAYPWATGEAYLRLLARLRAPARCRYRDVARRLGLDLTRRIGDLSHGNRQKVGLVQAFMHDPPLLILDEPTEGLDPLVRQEFFRMVEEASRAGRTVFLSSHNLPEVERLCDRVAVVREGRLVAVERVAALKERRMRRVEVRFAGAPPRELLHGLEGVRDVEADGRRMVFRFRGRVPDLLARLARADVEDVVMPEPTLEDAFLGLYGARRRALRVRMHEAAAPGWGRRRSAGGRRRA